MITLIVAMDAHNGIAFDGKIPWHIKEDLKLFKEKTLNHKIIMGRKTFESIGRVLPQRENYVITHNLDFQAKGVKLIHDLELFLKDYTNSEEEIYVIGGAEIYQVSLPYAHRLAISLINKTYTCDTFFPMFNSSQYKIIETQEYDEFKYILLEKI